jgi:hypothetical protein
VLGFSGVTAGVGAGLVLAAFAPSARRRRSVSCGSSCGRCSATSPSHCSCS